MISPCFFCEAQSETNVIFFKSLLELSSTNNTKEEEAAKASIRAQDNPTYVDKVIWKQRIMFSQNTYEPKDYMEWRMTGSVELCRKGSGDYRMSQAELDNTHSVAEKKERNQLDLQAEI